ncbi:MULTISPECIES: DUF928 domain-containing protein [unclassified Tolypothrix]|uniref:DUF928 domain-containing protein n=1 Tax=unclassified Tolypothrix TaxID=2649714 RepID=UPI0005EAA21C|nr:MULTISPECIES: DUF928 domain-containing protein [unclassified Tolypothrix]BAY89916.1 hypothetical protein NIES3275_19200 [Microchaete diplosiphon NIES-3275]EKE96908.1 hypothetical protein FDUTEX481_06174 [Tolypothrix sp. PCC 7601]MBE9082143.1 DUF928 domain-containing protein [Tolypothrix sp. LEGE 11397]UYD24152.1 DUF928 domain-containing protein [Tolypothrix sp. PCC 7712]UYD33617.1 DUF928 domain-containing protein [Tolypothrix sp. PCC 7601]
MKFYRWKMGLALALALAFIGFGASKGKAQPFQHRQQILASTTSPIKQNSSQQSQPKPATASPVKFKRPPLSPRGAPGNRKGGGTRDGYICSALEIKERLMALVPAVESEPGISHVWGLTLEASPTLWFYVPYQPQDIKVGELEIWDETDPDPRNYQQTYQGTFKVTDTPGAIALTLPSTVKLEPGKNYHWYLTLNMNCDREAQAVNVNGWIQRVKLSNSLPPQQSTERNRVIFYAENGIWYDAITLLAQMRRRQPQTQILLTDWQKLFRDIGLEEFANKPIVPCCQPGIRDYTNLGF